MRDITYAIVGTSHIGSALSHLFGRAGIPVLIANTRGPETLDELAADAGSSVRPATMAEALECDVVLMAIPFGAVEQFASAMPDWTGKTVVDATNDHYSAASTDRLGDRPSAQRNAALFPGAHVVKAFNQLPAATLGAPAPPGGGRRVIFVSSDSPRASEVIAELVESLGLAAVQLGRLDQGGRLIEVPHALVLRHLVEHPLSRTESSHTASPRQETR